MPFPWCSSLLLLAGIGAGLQAATDGDDPALLRRRIAELEQKVHELATLAVPYRVLVETQARIDFPSSSVKGISITPEWSRFLALDEASADKVDAAVHQACAEVTSLIAPQQPQSTRDENGITLVISDFRSAGRTVEKRLQDRLHALLGADRLILAEHLADPALFAHFGEGTQTYRITRAARGTWDIQIEREVSPGVSASESLRIGDREALGRLEVLLPLLPGEWLDAARAASPPLPGDRAQHARTNAGDF